eukprot:324495-Amphidinium_carterae.3
MTACWYEAFDMCFILRVACNRSFLSQPEMTSIATSRISGVRGSGGERVLKTDEIRILNSICPFD